MKTMDCSTLEMLIENHEPIELIDIRPSNQFAAMHIPGARSVPFAKLASPGIFFRPRQTPERLHIVVSDSLVRASLASGILQASGYVNTMVVDGGMKAWVARGFPVLNRKLSFTRLNILKAGAIALGLASGIALALNQVLIAFLILICAAALLLKADLLARTPAREIRTSTIAKIKAAPAY